MAGRRMVAAGVALTAVVGGGIAGAVLGVPGLSGASTSPTSTTMPARPPRLAGPFGRELGERDLLDAAAKALHLSTSGLLDKLSDGKTTIADVAKAQHVDVQTVIDAMDAAAQHDIADIVNQPFPAFPKLGPMGGPGGKGRFGPPGLDHGFGDLRRSADAVAKALGISTPDLFSDLRSGQSIADIAKAKHVDVNGIVTLLVDDAKARLEAAVKNGELTRDEATSIESNLQERITQAVNGSFPMRFGREGRGLPFAGRGFDGFGATA